MPHPAEEHVRQYNKGFDEASPVWDGLTVLVVFSALAYVFCTTMPEIMGFVGWEIVFLLCLMILKTTSVQLNPRFINDYPRLAAHIERLQGLSRLSLESFDKDDATVQNYVKFAQVHRLDADHPVTQLDFLLHERLFQRLNDATIKVQDYVYPR